MLNINMNGSEEFFNKLTDKMKNNIYMIGSLGEVRNKVHNRFVVKEKRIRLCQLNFKIFD